MKIAQMLREAVKLHETNEREPGAKFAHNQMHQELVNTFYDLHGVVIGCCHLLAFNTELHVYVRHPAKQGSMSTRLASFTSTILEGFDWVTDVKVTTPEFVISLYHPTSGTIESRVYNLSDLRSEIERFTFKLAAVIHQLNKDHQHDL